MQTVITGRVVDRYRKVHGFTLVRKVVIGVGYLVVIPLMLLPLVSAINCNFNIIGPSIDTVGNNFMEN